MGLDTAINVLTSPRDGFNQLKNKSLILFAIVFLIFSNTARPFAISGSSLIIGSIFSVLSVLYTTLIIFIFARLFNGQGSFSQTFQALSFANIPMIFLGPAALLEIIFSGEAGFGNITAMASFGLSIWSVYLFIVGIREIHETSTMKAIFLSLTPFILPLILLLFFGLTFAFYLI